MRIRPDRIHHDYDSPISPEKVFRSRLRISSNFRRASLAAAAVCFAAFVLIWIMKAESPSAYMGGLVPAMILALLSFSLVRLVGWWSLR